MKEFVLGLDFGSNAVRALIVDIAEGREYGASGCIYPGGENGIYMLPDNPHLARQNPLGYLAAMTTSIQGAIEKASVLQDFNAAGIVGIGVDATASTPIPVDAQMRPLAASSLFQDNLNAYAWMWKDHTSISEAEKITAVAREYYPEYLRKCGGTYSSEWYWSKIMHCFQTDREVFDATHVWLDFPDFIPAVLGGINAVSQLKPGICAAGHKALYCDEWGGYPTDDFFFMLEPELIALRHRMPSNAYDASQTAAVLSPEWAEKLGLCPGIPIAAGIIDAHAGAVGAGIGTGRMVKIIGTSSCDIITVPSNGILADIPGICGQVHGSVLPGYVGIEAGQAAVGDIFNWFVSDICGAGHERFATLEAEAEQQYPGQHGLIALDWHNGNRNVLCDQQLSGLLLGMTLKTTQVDIYRALIEATAFGARKILDRLAEYDIAIDEIVCCGGIAEKSPLLMQIYADILNSKLLISASSQTCALGAAIFAAVSAGRFATVEDAQKRFCHFKEKVYHPINNNVSVYQKLYEIYSDLHDGFGNVRNGLDYGMIMKKINIKNK
eukprot:TRINITY_DN9586_c0_g1_i2.p1 TRINITY_DN9586_c0_g1~~TRINITY_DN9586_c0_g1_i2.p1  ORF type:complete len:552 (+),score=111.85 TRINITY_DN9586_c0_g1_i2:294-1949(+)